MNRQQEPKVLKVCILFGGRSAEHEVSIQSAKNVLQALDAKKYEPTLVGIDKAGRWHLLTMQMFCAVTDNGVDIADAGGMPVSFLVGDTNHGLHEVDTGKKATDIDIVFPALHGTYGEDGTLQGMLELLAIPYIGPGVLGSAASMDKDVMKRLLRDAGIATAPFITVRAEQLPVDSSAIFSKLGRAVFVKPANMGSSIGVSRATNDAQLQASLKNAFRYDTKVLIETEIKGYEIECAVLGNEHPQASKLGQITAAAGDFYSYNAKYVSDDGAELKIPAELPGKIAARAQHIALAAYKALECEGMARVDMFINNNGDLIVNELNTIPGFTQISMYPKLWQATGLPYDQLITSLIELAIARHHKRQQLKTSII